MAHLTRKSKREERKEQKMMMGLSVVVVTILVLLGQVFDYQDKQIGVKTDAMYEEEPDVEKEVPLTTSRVAFKTQGHVESK